MRPDSEIGKLPAQVKRHRFSRLARSLPSAVHRGGNAHHLAVFSHRAAGDVDTVPLEQLNDAFVGQGFAGELPVDQAANAVAYRLRGMRAIAVRGRYGR